MLNPEDGSFRDRNNRVYYSDEKVIRGISKSAFDHWDSISAEPFFLKMLEHGDVVQTSLLDNNSELVENLQACGWEAVLEHERIPFISYSYEWTFGMLKDAALLHLDILERSISRKWTLKDATSFNVQWTGAKPTFIDLVSFEPYQQGDPWVGYRQFCMMFLIPLMMKAYRDIDYIPFLRSNLEGVDITEAIKFFPKTALLKKGVFTNIYLHSKMQNYFAEGKSDSNKKEIKHTKAMVLGTIQGLKRTVRKLKLQNVPTTWGTYEESHSYDDESYIIKQQLIKQYVSRKHRSLVWDLGCNTGTFSNICTPHADYVVAMDGDPLAIEKLYQRQKADAGRKILPLIMDMSNLSPGQGWRGKERKALEERATPDFLICLALIHHIVISANIPLRSFIEWLRDLNSDVVIEFVGLEDEMTKQLLKNKVNQYTDFTQENFEIIVNEMFTINEATPLKNGVRMLYYLEPAS